MGFPNPLGLLDKGVDIIRTAADRLIPDKGKRDEFKQQLALIAASTDADLAKHAATFESDVAKSQGAINLEEAKHKSLFVAGWRPFIGWVCGSSLAWHFVLYDILNWFVALFRASWMPPTMSGEDSLMMLITSMLGIGAMRSFEKSRGVNHK